MIINMVGGSPNKLNFTVTNTEVQKENTIWVKTDSMTGYSISPVEPSLAEGMVWIKTSDSGVFFNALKENELAVFLAGCYQCVSGAWVRKEAAIYQKGWQSFSQEFNGYYFNNGEYDEATGGWTSEGYTNSATQYTTVVAGSVGTTLDAGTNAQNRVCPVGTENAVDLTDITTLTITVDTVSSAGSIRFLVLNSKNCSDTAAEVSLLGGGDKTLDVSALEGNYYLAVVVIGSNTTYTISTSVSAVRGE